MLTDNPAIHAVKLDASVMANRGLDLPGSNLADASLRDADLSRHRFLRMAVLKDEVELLRDVHTPIITDVMG